ncbi:MAG: hypothetical protein ACXVLT_08210 [Flavisolibacter sp.]
MTNYFCRMINENELRLGNYILQKINTRILPVKYSPQHYDLVKTGNTKDLFPLTLKAEILEKCGFIENKKYPLLPEAREFILVLPVIGNANNEIRAYIKNNKECFARVMLNNLPVSNNFYNVHQLQNVYFALTNEELKLTL